jgi:hypothetical protein
MADARITRDERSLVETLGVPGLARQLTAGAVSANTPLTVGCNRVSLLAVGADIRYAVGSTTQTASATSHLLLANSRIDIALPQTANIAVQRAGGTDGTLHVTEWLQAQ